MYGRPDRPAVCVRLRPDEEMCGDNAEHALAWLFALEDATRPVLSDARPPFWTERRECSAAQMSTQSTTWHRRALSESRIHSALSWPIIEMKSQGKDAA